MRENPGREENTPSNGLTGGDAFSAMLAAMSREELTAALEDALETMTDETYDPALITAYLDALERLAPMPELPDERISWAALQRKLEGFAPARGTPRGSLRRVWRAGLAAALAAACMLGCMVVAQAAGLDVFGAMARWTDDVFSFGTVRSGGTVDIDYPADSEKNRADGTDTTNAAGAYASLQEALDAFGITEVSEPAWLPKGYLLDSVVADRKFDGTLQMLTAEYTDGSEVLYIQIAPYFEEAHMQVEKTDAAVETFPVDNLIIYLLENTQNNAAVWATEHYECFVGGTAEKDVLKQVVLSAYANDNQ